LNDSLDGDSNILQCAEDPHELEKYMKSNESVKITKLKLIGSGTQADVYTCNLRSPLYQSPSKIFVTKTKKIVDNFDIANQIFKDMFKEFNIAKNLRHPNVV
jgi:hypothetical protein